MYRPETRPQLWAFIGAHFALWLPHKKFTPGHSTPFDFVADAFFNPQQDLAAWANRSGLKTLCSSVIAALAFLFSDVKIRGRVLAGSEAQANNLYSYWEDWCFGILRSRLQGQPGRLLTRLDNGEFAILAASPKQVHGPKVQHLYRDEIDEMDPDIYASSIGMLDSRDGVPSRTIDTSTWHHAHGPMGQLVEEAEQRRIKLHKWNVWESIAKCPEPRHQGGKGCRTCDLEPVCIAKARERDRKAKIGIASDCCGLFAIDDAIKQLSQWSKENWEAQAECKRPTLTGLVYPHFDRAIHVKPDLDFDDDLPIFRAIDFGLNDFVCLWLQENKHGQVFVVDEYWSEQTRLGDHARHIMDEDRLVRVEGTYVDPAGRSRNDQTGYSAIDVLNGAGIPCTYSLTKWSTEVKNGVDLIRAYLQPAAGQARLFIAGKCKMLMKAFEAYKLRTVNGEYIDEPIKPQACDHPLDALRYFFVNRHRPQRGGVAYMGYT